MARKKMTLQELKDLFTSQADPVPGDPDELTKATAKNHKHKVNPVYLPHSKPVPQPNKKTQIRKEK